MNANDLADKLNEWYNYSHENMCNEAATMLRQQQAEIEALKMDIHSLTYGERLAKYFNKPVAWMHKNPDYAISKHQSLEYNIPLYTHPAKTLTDEEIQEISYDFGEIGWLGDTTYEFARTILKKASEK